MLTKEQNDLLTQADAGKPMGDFMRRYWMPAIMSERLPESGGAPIPLKLLGEELVAYRDEDGKVAIMSRYCPHRRASLVIARNEKTNGNCHLTCLYHGWKIAGDGTVLETPPEPVNSQFARSVKHIAYPTHETGGVVWVYMGPRDKQHPFPAFPFVNRPDGEVWGMVARNPCNWLQALENGIEAAHAPYLHMTRSGYDEQRAGPIHYRFLHDPRPEHGVHPAPWGLTALQRYNLKESGKSLCWIRSIAMPFYTCIGFPFDDVFWGTGMVFVPIDDENHYVWMFIYNVNGGPLPENFVKELEGQQMFGKINPDNDYLSDELVNGAYIQHRDWMKSGESFSGYEGVNTQDLAIQYSLGPIVDRTKEHLAVEDINVIQTRRVMLQSLDKFLEGEEPLPGLQDDQLYGKLDCRAVIVDLDVSSDDVLKNRDWVGTV